MPLDKCVAMLNMDMIGRIKDNKVYIGGVGTGSTFKAILEQAQKQEPDFKIEYSAGGYAASDHTSFVAKKIPVLFFFSGLHSDYHKPSDTWDKINAPSAAQLLDLVGDVALQLADAPSAANRSSPWWKTSRRAAVAEATDRTSAPFRTSAR